MEVDDAGKLFAVLVPIYQEKDVSHQPFMYGMI